MSGHRDRGGLFVQTESCETTEPKQLPREDRKPFKQLQRDRDGVGGGRNRRWRWKWNSNTLAQSKILSYNSHVLLLKIVIYFNIFAGNFKLWTPRAIGTGEKTEEWIKKWRNGAGAA